jgi:hypothetical protein
MTQFERAVQTYRRELEHLLDIGAEGKFALIGAGEVQGVFATNAEARTMGHQLYGLEFFLTKEVLHSDLGSEQYRHACRA